MKHIGKTLLIPFLDAVLESADSYEMGRGCRIIHLKDEYRRALKDNEAVSAGYEKIIPNLKIDSVNREIRNQPYSE